jgi:hypothetical protein
VLAGADLYRLRVDLERRIEDRLQATGAIRDERIMDVIREELAGELNRWGQDLIERTDLLLAANDRLVSSLEERVTALERRTVADTEAAGVRR